jgi:hypothetical protein
MLGHVQQHAVLKDKSAPMGAQGNPHSRHPLPPRTRHRPTSAGHLLLVHFAPR